jgi:hypothetical protein
MAITLLNDFSHHMDLHESHNLTFISTENQIDHQNQDGRSRKIALKQSLSVSVLCLCPSWCEHFSSVVFCADFISDTSGCSPTVSAMNSVLVWTQIKLRKSSRMGSGMGVCLGVNTFRLWFFARTSPATLLGVPRRCRRWTPCWCEHK